MFLLYVFANPFLSDLANYEKYWEWNPSGWLYKMGVYDFAGSGPVHIASGFAALAWSLMLGARKDHNGESIHNKMPQFRPHNPFLVGLGTILIWFGWFAFNGTLISPSPFT